ncbi:hypothetical protein [Methylomonas sp. 11b]|uniref:hypothetical protein n=1 Tax=Methylomonas sp. 11b TaxID=1168169 RepID=UPI00047AD8CB|nr:hypothetical protein [Methylomonas sp. 11b]
MNDKLDCLYKKAKDRARNTEGFGESFAGKCGNISLGLLQDARRIFGQEVQLFVGYVEIKGTKLFHFEDHQLNEWLNGKPKEKYSVHCWLSLHEEPIDLTLAESIYEMQRQKLVTDLIPEGITYIGQSQAIKHQITHHKKMEGDDVLSRIGMLPNTVIPRICG